MSVCNGAATLERALHSVAFQTLSDWQTVIVDDGSRDATPRILEAWVRRSGRSRVQVLNYGRKLGLTRALNEAAAHVASPLIARLDADDWWAPEKLTHQLDFLKQHPGVGLLGCRYFNVWDDRKQLVWLPATDAVIRRRIWWRNPFGHSCVVMRRSLFEQVGRYDERLPVSQDLDLWFRLLDVTKVANLPVVLCYRHVQNNPAKYRQQMKQTVETVRKYRRLLHKPWWYELALVEPMLLSWLR